MGQSEMSQCWKNRDLKGTCWNLRANVSDAVLLEKSWCIFHFSSFSSVFLSSSQLNSLFHGTELIRLCSMTHLTWKCFGIRLLTFYAVCVLCCSLIHTALNNYSINPDGVRNYIGQSQNQNFQLVGHLQYFSLDTKWHCLWFLLSWCIPILSSH